MKILNVNIKYLWIFLLFISCTMFSQEQDYIPFRRGKVWGLCDADKRIMVQPQYYSISSYDNAVGGFHAEQNGRFGIIDKNSIQIMPFISEGKPITVSGDTYVVYDGFDFYRYSMKTKMRLDRLVLLPNRVRDDWGWTQMSQSASDEKMIRERLDDEDWDILEPFDNDQYDFNFEINYLEITSDKRRIGIYITKLKKIFLDTPNIVHVGVQPYNGKFYVVTTDDSDNHLFGLVDENSREVYPIKYNSIALMNGSNTVILSEIDSNNPNNLIFKTILPNNRILDGEYYPKGKILKNGYPLQLYYKIIDGLENYAGEDGTLYFEG